MKNISFIVNENLEKPLLTLLQPKASPRTNATEFLEITYNGWRMVNAPEVRSVEWNTTLRKLWNQRKRDRFSVQFSKKEFDGWKEAERYKSFRKRIPADVIRFQEGRSTAEPVADDEKKKLKIDFRVQGIPQAAVEQEEKANTNNWKGQCFQSEITQAENWDVQAFSLKVGYQWIYISYKEFRLQDIVITPHRARFTRANIFSRVVPACMLHLFVCFLKNNHLHERLSCFAFSWSRFFSSTFSSPISSSSLLDPSNMANVCAIPQACLAVLPNRFRSHFLHGRQPSQWHRFSRQRLVRMSFARQIRLSWARNVFSRNATYFGYRKVDNMVKSRRLWRTNNLEVTQSIEVYMEFVARTVNISSDHQTEQLQRKFSHLY